MAANTAMIHFRGMLANTAGELTVEESQKLAFIYSVKIMPFEGGLQVMERITKEGLLEHNRDGIEGFKVSLKNIGRSNLVEVVDEYIGKNPPSQLPPVNNIPRPLEERETNTYKSTVAYHE